LQTTADIKAALAKSATANEIIKDLISENAKTADKRLSLYTRYKGEASGRDYDEALDPLDYNGIPIYRRTTKSRLKVNHRIHAPFIRKIVSNMIGFIGTVDIGYEADKFAAPVDTNTDGEKIAPEKTPAELQLDELLKNFERTNSLNKTHSTLVEDADATGCAYALMFQDQGELYMKRLAPWETIVVRNQQTEFPEFGLRYWKMKVGKVSRLYVELYDSENVYYFLENEYHDFEPYAKAAPVDGGEVTGRMPHFMGRMPIIEFPKNEQRIGDPEITLSMQDAFNVSLSDFSSELAQLRLAYLARKEGKGNIDPAFLTQLEQTGILTGEWAFVAKNVSAEAVSHNQSTLKQLIFDLSNSVDFSDPAFAAAMPIIAFKLKCKGLDDSATQIINQFTDSYFYMFEILVGFWKKWKKAPANLEPTDLTVTIPKNLPVNVKELMDTFINAGGKLSNKTLLEIYLKQMGANHSVEEEETRIENEGNSEVSQPADFYPNTTTTGLPGADVTGGSGNILNLTANGQPQGKTGRSNNA